jgi:hypothetical protein
MATLYISEYAHLGQQAGTVVAAAEQPPLAEQTVAIGASSAQSAVFNTKTEWIGLHADVVCSILIGLTPTATASNKRLAAGVDYMFKVQRGQNCRLAVITNS